MTWDLVAIAACVLLEGFFSGAEIGFYSVNRVRLRSRVEGGWRGAGMLHRLLEQPGATIMTTLVGTNVMVYAATALATGLLQGYLYAELLATLVMTPVILVFGELIPKDIFRRKADTWMYALAGPIDRLRWLLTPVTAALRGLVRLVTGGAASRDRGAMFSRAALREWIAEGRQDGVLSDYQHALSANVLDLLKKRVLPAMIPLDKVEMVSAELSGGALREALRAMGHSRVPVYRGSRKNVVGILHALDYICASEPDRSAADLAHRAVEVKPRGGVHAALVALQRNREQMAIVVNRAGKPAGIVTVKDLVEEIVGELQDF